MTKMTRKLLLSIITVVLTVVALGTTTFAWFTLTNTAQIQEFEAKIIADSGIEIAIGDLDEDDLNDLTWKTVITPEDIYGYFNGTDVKALQLLNHVTTTDGIRFTTLGTTTKGAGVVNGFIELPIHFRSDSADTIKWTSASISGEATPWPVDTPFTDAKGNPQTVGSTMSINPADAIRMAIQGTVDSDSQHVVAYENPALGTNVRLGEGGSFGTNDYDDNLIIGDPSDDIASVPPTGGNYTNGSYQYFYNKNAGTVPLWGIETVDTVKTEEVINGQTIAELSSEHETTLTQTYYGNIVIRIWLEGWDANSFDAQLARRISVRFEFFGVDVPPVPTP